MFRILGSIVFVLILVGAWVLAGGERDEPKSNDSASNGVAVPAQPATQLGNKQFNF